MLRGAVFKSVCTAAIYNVKLSAFWSPLDFSAIRLLGGAHTSHVRGQPASNGAQAKDQLSEICSRQILLLFITDMVSSEILTQRLECLTTNARGSTSDVDICLQDHLRSCLEFVGDNLVGNDIADPVVQSLS